MSRRVVVTGGAGLVGSHLCERLLQNGDEVICVDNFSTGDRRNVEPLASLDAFTLLTHDIAQPLHLEGPLDLVLHFASPASPVDYLRLPLETLRAGSTGTETALELARHKRARFLLASTSEVYGDPEIHPQHEEYWGNVNPIGPRSVYDEAKRYGEALTMAYRRVHGVDTGIIRIFNTYGPRMRAEDGRAIPTFIWQALNELPLTVAGDGSQTRSTCYVDDLVEAVLLMAASDLPGPVNLGNPEEISMIDLAHRIRDAVGSPSPIVFTPRPVDDPNVRRPDITKAKELLGWTPSFDLGYGLKSTIEWFRQQAEGANRPAGL
ncbi:UDP-glucuronic acid decarboxylase family protein [Streptomyces sp. NPDC096176]|uniref:UDP-glucuronic acid decarboxylase family protein n=1 Tax=Streptomyces sp. NPDC096176 TaxID=3366079 RepID=UPI0037FCB9C9